VFALGAGFCRREQDSTGADCLLDGRAAAACRSGNGKATRGLRKSDEIAAQQDAKGASGQDRAEDGDCGQAFLRMTSGGV